MSSSSRAPTGKDDNAPLATHTVRPRQRAARTVDILPTVRYFEKHPGAFKQFCDVLDGLYTGISLRTIQQAYQRQRLFKHNGVLVSMRKSYSEWAQIYGARNFDVFGRNKKKNSLYLNMHGRKLHTTVGQAQFFHWATECGVLEYVKSHRETIRKEASVELKRQREAARQRKRKRVSVREEDEALETTATSDAVSIVSLKHKTSGPIKRVKTDATHVDVTNPVTGTIETYLVERAEFQFE